MKRISTSVSWVVVLFAAAAGVGCTPRSASIERDADDIAGVVTSASGPEAGVWVIAETRDLPTRFAKIVVN